MLEFKELVFHLKRKLKKIFDADISAGHKTSVLEKNLKNEEIRGLSAKEVKESGVKEEVNLAIEGYREEPHAIKEANVCGSTGGSPLTYGTFEDCPCGSQCSHIAVQVQGKILNVQDSQLRSELRMPPNLVRRLSHDIATLSQTEPRGVRGCSLYMNLERKDRRVPLGEVLNFEPNSLATFELYVTLVEEKTGWSGFLNALQTLFLPCNSRSSFKAKIFISAGYQIVKKKLYKVS